MAFQKILVALDHSEASEPIFAQALDLAQREASHLRLFSCIQWSPNYYPNSISGLDPSPEQTFSALNIETLQLDLARTQTYLGACQQRAEAAGIQASVAQEVGDPGALICQQARDWGADLILVGRRGRSGLSELVLGSVSNYVVHRAPCSVLVLQGTLLEG